jgi:hypothetical protein
MRARSAGTRGLRAALLCAIAAFSGCASCENAPDGALERCEDTVVIPSAVRTDILFVIDDSGSMSEEQANLRANLSSFVQALASAPIANEFQVGVTTTAISDFNGSTTYASGPSSGVPFPNGALVAIDQGGGTPTAGDFVYANGAFGGTRILAAGSPTLVQDFQANVLVGTAGTGKEQAFLAARRALDASVAGGVNVGFLRPGARLAIVFVSDEDDCSDSANLIPAVGGNDRCHDLDVKQTGLDGIDDFVSYLSGPIAGEERDVLLAAIVPVDPATLAPSCGQTQCTNRGCASAFDKGDRFVDLVGALGPVRTRLASICDASFADALADIAGLLVSQTVPLQGTPADWRMLVAGIERAGATIPCTIAHEGTPEAAPGQADAVYSPPREGTPASVTFQRNCRVQQGDRIALDVICAG